MAKTVDALGDALRPDGRYFVQDTRSGVGNCVLWWGKKSSGYVCEIGEAGVYTGYEVAGMRDTDVPWPEQFVLDHAVRHVRLEVLRRVRKAVPA